MDDQVDLDVLTSQVVSHYSIHRQGTVVHMFAAAEDLLPQTNLAESSRIAAAFYTAIYSYLQPHNYQHIVLDANHRSVHRVLCRCSPQLYKIIHSLCFRALLLRPAEKIMCPMITVSQLIQQYNIK